ncbi:MAG: hypothetical protein AUG51_00880 [Acidobacteria bacterium 13_1_20CM_3_53_8]|nr:MAG: hypothetical protein AUG51_00880 [Acidobacteria bacterium 13_1_20CM_3_53_8]
MANIQSPSRRLDALFREFDNLAAENRNALDGTDKKLSIAFGVAATLIAAGLWRSEPVFFLIVPYLILAIAFFAAVQLGQIVLLGAQLAVVEKRINQELGGQKVMSYFSVTVLKVCDAPTLIVPGTKRKQLTFNALYTASAAVVLLAAVGFSIFKGLPALIVKGWAPTGFYFVGVCVAFAVVAFVIARAAMGKRLLIAVIEQALDASANETLEPPAPTTSGTSD